MARFKLVRGERIPLTPEEEALRDAEEQQWVTVEAPVQLREQEFQKQVRQAGQQFSESEKLLLTALYAEVQRYRADNTTGTPLVDAFAAVFPNRTKAQVALQLENRVEGFLTTAITALANKIKDGG